MIKNCSGKVWLDTLSRIVVGLIFIFSGFIKSLDPMGSAIKFEEYFRIFSLQFLDQFSLHLSILLSCFELLLGVTIFAGLYRRIVAIFSAATLLFFTLLTLYLYIADPIESCGCFGEFFVMTNGQTLLKNILIFIAAVPYLCVSFSSISSVSRVKAVVVLSLATLLSLIAPLYAVIYLPIVDAMPYEIGADIRAKKSIPDGAPMDEYVTTLLYKNIADGEVREFSVEDTTWHDNSKWSYIDTKTELIKRGFQPEISSFNIFNSNIDDVTEEVLNAPLISLIIVNDIDVSDVMVDNFSKITALNLKDRVDTMVVTAYSSDQILERFPWVDDRVIYHADGTLLTTIMRAKIGVVTLENGVVVDKFNLRRLK